MAAGSPAFQEPFCYNSGFISLDSEMNRPAQVFHLEMKGLFKIHKSVIELNRRAKVETKCNF